MGGVGKPFSPARGRTCTIAALACADSVISIAVMLTSFPIQSSSYSKEDENGHAVHATLAVVRNLVDQYSPPNLILQTWNRHASSRASARPAPSYTTILSRLSKTSYIISPRRLSPRGRSCRPLARA